VSPRRMMLEVLGTVVPINSGELRRDAYPDASAQSEVGQSSSEAEYDRFPATATPCKTR
jgi:hypothetical protein